MNSNVGPAERITAVLSARPEILEAYLFGSGREVRARRTAISTSLFSSMKRRSNRAPSDTEQS